MQRFVVSVVILCAILGVCTYSYHLFSSTRVEMLALLEEIEDAALAGEENEVVSQMCADYSEKWKEKEKKLMRVIRHPQLDEISSLTAELRYLAADDGYSHLLAAVERIKVNMDKVGSAEIFNG